MTERNIELCKAALTYMLEVGETPPYFAAPYGGYNAVTAFQDRRAGIWFSTPENGEWIGLIDPVKKFVLAKEDSPLTDMFKDFSTGWYKFRTAAVLTAPPGTTRRGRGLELVTWFGTICPTLGRDETRPEEEERPEEQMEQPEIPRAEDTFLAPREPMEYHRGRTVQFARHGDSMVVTNGNEPIRMTTNTTAGAWRI